MKTITFYSYKGGTGRSLVVANVARYLARFGQKVVAIDLDLEAPGLHYKMSFANLGQPLQVTSGVIDYLISSKTPESKKQSLSDLTISVPLPAGTSGTIHLLPAGDVHSPTYWAKVSQVNWYDLFFGAKPAGIPLLLELKETIRAELQPDFLLIDARTGITEMGGVATTILADLLVCFFINNRENLDGVREVLRSAARSPRLPDQEPIEMIPVLARIPVTKEIQEAPIVEGIRSFLNEDAADLAGTIVADEILVLHSEPDLQLQEQILIGGEARPEESVLLRDYLRLLVRIVPADSMAPHISGLLDHVRSALYDNPDGAQLELEGMAMYLRYPEVYRELLRLYRIRNVSGERALSVVAAMWELTSDAGDPLLFEVSMEAFRKLDKTQASGQWAPLASALFVARGCKDRDLALTAAELHERSGDYSKAAKLLHAVLEGGLTEAPVVIRLLRNLVWSAEWDNASTVVESWRERLAGHPEFLVQWSRMILNGGEDIPAELLSPSALEAIGGLDGSLVFHLLWRGGRLEEARDQLKGVIRDAFRRGSIGELADLRENLEKAGRSELFESAAASALSSSEYSILEREMRYRAKPYRVGAPRIRRLLTR